MNPEEFKQFIDRQIAARPIEARIVRKVVRALKAADKPVVEVYDGGEYVKVRTERDILEQVFNLDEAWLITERRAWVRITMGNEWDVISDYTLSVEAALQPVFDYIERSGN